MDERLQLSLQKLVELSSLRMMFCCLFSRFSPPLAEIARTSLLNRRWRNLWHNVTCLDFDATTLLPRERWEESRAWFTECVNKVIDDRIAMPELPKVKDLRIRYGLDEKQARACHIDRWIDFAVSNQVETLHLDFARYTEIILHRREYTFLKETWYRAPSGLSNIKCLKSLVLSCVNVSKQFIEFNLSSCLLLEDLSWCYAGIDTDLDVSGVPPLRLRRLKIAVAEGFALTKLCAPYLTSLYYDSTKLSPQKIDVPMLTDLTIGSSTLGMRPLMKYLEHFWSYLPQLEKLYLIISDPQRFRFVQKPELVKLKYLKLHFDYNSDPVFHRIVNFINACPLLETFAFQMCFPGPKNTLSFEGRGKKQKWRKVEKNCSFKCLKVLELYGAKRKLIDQEVIKCIISKAPILEKLTIDTNINTGVLHGSVNSSGSTPDIVEAVKTKTKELCQGHPHEIEIIVT